MPRDPFSVKTLYARGVAWGAAWVLLTIVFCIAAAWQAERTLAQDLSRQLNQKLPEKLTLALQMRLSGDDLASWVASRLEQDLASLPVSGSLPLLKRCSVGVVRLVDDPALPAAGAENILVRWQIGSEQRRSAFSLNCEVSWPPLVGTCALLALLIAGLMALMPAPLTSVQRARIAGLVQKGLPFSRARQAATNLDGEQLQWFEQALPLCHGDTDSALACAEMNDQLVFDCQRLEIRARGIPIKLPKTPFFYYLWYAQRRQQGEGWVLNPPVNRPDREGAVSLIALMAENGGHARSINDLRENGLRAKTLDQNRNKIRDELVSALGENLAAPYLFESERDLKSGRYRYRLALGAAFVNIQITDL
ncbi:hypothetical protein [uncultured Microbulbifer sp.]|uniref:hypothetical protein n=1 Tax=uncultured Microbulbifer sp. TaxID=348147 RepID=UPI00262E6E4B|nr:hypothetical protein [uncultured Microbulbifer sp.]